ncbi:hypothetical protein [Winogradskyella sp.]|uniref:hypothetical protein n=1 Tax=Winogradskyella sp. TaxID=1883156 RepID=UPI0025F347B4|nr:hypothetical protein [Winogradskyella sp.]
MLGRFDKIDFPKLNLHNIDVKIDTGAYTSAIHCSKIKEENNMLYCIFESSGHPNFKTGVIIFED